MSTGRGDIVKKKADDTPGLFDAEEYVINDADVRAATADLFSALDEGEVEKALRDLPRGLRGILLKKRGLRVFSLKTLKEFAQSKEDETSPTASGRLESWGIVSNGTVLTVKDPGFYRIGRACDLLEVLEPNPVPKYFVSKRRLEGMKRHKARHKAAGHGFGMKIVATQVMNGVDGGEDSEGV